MSLEPGDIVEIRTSKGIAYAQVTHRHISYPEVVRVFQGIHERAADDICAVADQDVAFTAMLALSSAINGNRIEAKKAGSKPLHGSAADFPRFKMPIRDKQGGIAYWWFWDGDTLTYDADPAAAGDDVPMREVLSIEQFLERAAQV